LRPSFPTILYLGAIPWLIVTGPANSIQALDMNRTPPLPILVTGITGVAGFNAFRYLQARYPGQVVGIRPEQTWRLNGTGIVVLDIEDEAGHRALCEQHRFGSVLNAVGNCALKKCELDPNMARRLNVASATMITAMARRLDCRLVHLSSDLVFSGKGAGGYRETDELDPVTIYGSTMAEAEAIMAAQAPAAAVLRISLPMGPSFNRHAGAIDWIDSRFRKDRPATLYFDEVRSCAYTDDLNRVFERFLAGDERGIYHLGGPRSVTLYQMGQIVNRVGGYHPVLLKGCPRHAAGPIPPRAGNVSMCSAKLLDLLGQDPFHPWPANSDLYPDSRDWHEQRLAGEEGSRERIAQQLYSAGHPVRACRM
jgi:dTDP-4-dehydrorhamnose reductase